MRKSLLVLLGVLLISILCVGAVSADPPLVDGYYQIGSASDLLWFGQQVNAGHVTYNAKLTADINLGESNISIGSATYPFMGDFEGAGWNMTNIKYKLFYLGDSATIENVRFVGLGSTATEPIFINSNSVNAKIEKCCFESFYFATSNANIYVINKVTGQNCLFNDIKMYARGSWSTGSHDTICCIFYASNVSNCYAVNIIGSAVSTDQHAPRVSALTCYCTNVANCAVVSASLSGSTTASYAVSYSPFGLGNTVFTNNYQSSSITSKNGYFTVQQGTKLAQSVFNTESFWHGGSYLNWDFTDTWVWDSVNNLPQLRGFTLTIDSLTLVSPSTSEEGQTISANVVATGVDLMYQWYGTSTSPTITLTAVYCSDQTNYPFNQGGEITVTDGTGYYRYNMSTDVLTPLNSSGEIRWETVQKLGQYDSLGDVLSTSDGYVQSIIDARQYINTGFKPNQNTRVIGDFSTSSLNDDACDVFGVDSGSTGTMSFSYSVYSSKSVLAFGNSYDNTISTPPLNTKFTIDANKRVWTVNGISKTLTSYTFQQTYALYLFAWDRSGSALGGYNSNNTIYYVKIYDNDNLVRNYIPILYGSTYALYDQVENKVYNNDGTGSFTGGGTPTPLTYTHYSSVSWSPLSGQTTANLSYTQAPVGDNYFKVIVSTPTKSLDSTTAGFQPLHVLVTQSSPIIHSFTLTNPLIGVYLPTSELVSGNVNATLYSGAISYQWYKSEDYRGAVNETLTAVYCSDQTVAPFNLNQGVTVTDGVDYFRYYPLTDVKESLTVSGVTWEVVNEIEYLRNDGNQNYINTKITGDGTLISTDITFGNVNPSNDKWVFGNYNGNNAQNYLIGTLNSKADFYFFNNQYYPLNANFDSTHKYRATINIDGGSKLYDLTNGNEYTVATTLLQGSRSASSSMTNDFALFGYIHGKGANHCSQVNIYECKIYENNVLVRDYQPIAVNDAYYMIDKVSMEIITTTPSTSGQYMYGTLSGGGTPTPLTFTHHISGQGTWSPISSQTSSNLSYSAPVGDFYYKVIVSGNGYSTDSLTTYAPFHVISFNGITNNTITTSDDFNTWVFVYQYYQNETLYLANDVILNTSSSIPQFNGTFYGQSHVLSNLTVPLFANLSGTVNDLTFTDSFISEYDSAGVLAKSLYTSNITNITADNCYVSAKYAGSLIGSVLGSDTSIADCTATLCTVVGEDSAGGITALLQPDTDIVNAQVSRCDILATAGVAYGVSP